jgi:hypothetical protein
MNAAVWGFIGVVVGGLITAFSAYFTERRTRRHNAASARLTAQTEFDEAIKAIKDSKTNWAIGWELTPWDETWRVIQPYLAGDMDEDAFRVVRWAYGFLFRLEQGLKTAGGKDSSGSSQFFADTTEAVLAAGTALKTPSRRRLWGLLP